MYGFYVKHQVPLSSRLAKEGQWKPHDRSEVHVKQLRYESNESPEMGWKKLYPGGSAKSRWGSMGRSLGLN
jgi:hypothetical protein